MKMGINIPEADDLIYFNSCASGFWGTKLPYMGSLDFFHVDDEIADKSATHASTSARMTTQQQ